MQVSKQPTALAQQECKLLLVAAALPSYREYWPRRAALKLQPPQGCLVCYRPLASQSSAGLLNALDVQISLCQMYMIYTAKLIFVARPHLEGRGQNLEPSPSTERGVDGDDACVHHRRRRARRSLRRRAAMRPRFLLIGKHGKIGSRHDGQWKAPSSPPSPICASRDPVLVEVSQPPGP